MHGLDARSSLTLSRRVTGYLEIDEILLLLYEADEALRSRGVSTKDIGLDVRRLLEEGMRKDMRNGIV
jgi:hypothetical protein